MARAREPEPKVGGAVAPEAVASVGREKEFAQNRMLEAMRQGGAAERGKIQAKAQLQATQMGTRSSQAVEAMRAREADRRAAERVRGEHLDRRFMEGQTRLTQHLISEREKAARDADALIREEDREIFNDLFKRHEGNVMARDMLDTARGKRLDGGLIDLAVRNLDSLEKMQKLHTIESNRVKGLTEEKKIYNILTKEVEDRITLTPYVSFDEEMVGSIQDFLDEDFKELGIDRAKATTILLTPMRRSLLAREIAGGRIKADDIRKMYITLKKRRVWAKEQVNELLGDKDKLMKPGRRLFPFESLFRKEEEVEEPTGWGSWWREKPTKPSEKGILLRKRQERLAHLTTMVDSFERLQDDETPMADNTGKVKDFVGKLIVGLNSPISFNYKEIMEAAMPDLEKVRGDLGRLREGERFDWDKMIDEAPDEPTREALQRARIIEEGGVEEETEEAGLGEMEEFLNMSRVQGD